MGVNGGSGNQLAFSEIQSFYGGSGPINISEYYRGGSQVPSTYTTTVSNPAAPPPVPSGWTGAHYYLSSVSGNQIASGTKPSHGGQASNLYIGSFHYTLTPNINVIGQSNMSVICAFGGGSSNSVGFTGTYRVSYSTVTSTGVHGSGTNMTKSFFFYNVSATGNGAHFKFSGQNFSGMGMVVQVWQGVASTSTVTNNCNTSVPSSGQLSINIFNNPGTPIG